jgi:hypothetical protein
LALGIVFLVNANEKNAALFEYLETIGRFRYIQGSSVHHFCRREIFFDIDPCLTAQEQYSDFVK